MEMAQMGELDICKSMCILLIAKMYEVKLLIC